ncbi:hypothetical protein [Bacillus sp. NPDC094106]|uniref:hypothetical protein n=1 Tax=Bacillus sp. NPDC094106 TaxID=3363949 RepID=UPI0038153659
MRSRLNYLNHIFYIGCHNTKEQLTLSIASTRPACPDNVRSLFPKDGSITFSKEEVNIKEEVDLFITKLEPFVNLSFQEFCEIEKVVKLYRNHHIRIYFHIAEVADKYIYFMFDKMNKQHKLKDIFFHFRDDDKNKFGGRGGVDRYSFAVWLKKQDVNLAEYFTEKLKHIKDE